MIYSLHGKLIVNENNFFVVECGGVGYRCAASLNTLQNLPKIGDDVFVYTYMAVRDDAVDLYGFISSEELNCFKLLTSVSSVGNKIGIAILSEFSPEQLYFMIASGDAKSITRAPGVGIKIAQRIVLELKDKVAKGITDNGADALKSAVGIKNVGDSAQSEAVAALAALGYSQSEAAVAVSRVNGDLPVEETIKLAIKELSRMV